MKKLTFFVALAFCTVFSLTTHAQIFFLADNIKGTSLTALNTTEVTSMGTSIACASCSATSVASTYAFNGGKIVFNLQNDAVVNALRSQLFIGKPVYNAYFIFSKPSGTSTSKPGTPATDYYYIKLTNYTVIEIDESSDGGRSTIQVSLGYSALNWTMKTVSATGALGTPQSFGWDFKTMNANTYSAIPPSSLGSF